MRFGAEFIDVIAAERIVGGDDDADTAVNAREFVDRDGVLDVAEASAAVFFGEDDAEEAHFGELGHDFGWEFGGFVPLHHVGSDFAFGEFADAAAELSLFVGEGKIHVGLVCRCLAALLKRKRRI